MTTSNIVATIPCDIQKVWRIMTAVENYHMWRSGVSRVEVIDEQQFIEYTKDGYATTITLAAVEPYSRLAFTTENSHTKGHWTCVLVARGGETELNITASVTSKKLTLRPVGQSIFERSYIKKEQEQFVKDLNSLC